MENENLLSCRVIILMSPIGRGQRKVILRLPVSVNHPAQSIANYQREPSQVYLIVLLILNVPKK